MNQGYDMVTSGCKTVFYRDGVAFKEEKTDFKDQCFETKEAVRDTYLYLFRSGLAGSPTKKMYKKEIIDQNNVCFPDLRRSQDIVFNYRYINCCNSLKITSYIGYNYTIEFTKRLLRLKENYYLAVNQIVRDVVNLHKEWGLEKKVKEVYSTFLYMYIVCFEANYVAKRNSRYLLNDPGVLCAFENANASGVYAKLIKFGVKKKALPLINILVAIKYFIRKLEIER